MPAQDHRQGEDSSSNGATPPIMNITGWTRLYSTREYDALSESFLSFLDYFYQQTFTKADAGLLQFINLFVESFLFFFTKPDFKVSPCYQDRFISASPTLTNLVAISVFKTTDPWVAMLKARSGAAVQLMTLLSPRNKIKVNYSSIFDQDPVLASKWWTTYWFCVEAFATETIYENCRTHLRNLDPRFVIYGPGSAGPCFHATYVDLIRDREFKTEFNLRTQKALGEPAIHSRPNPKKIAIASSKWIKNRSVYKCFYAFVEALKADYDLSLIVLGPPHEEVDTQGFEKIINLKFSANHLDLDPLQNHEFQLLYYPDIGMDYEGKFLANLRIAPIQITGYGHPVSTFGSKIDYFLGGMDVEDLTLAQNHYSERLVLMPGFAQYPVTIDYEIQDIKPSVDPLIINCPWGSTKINHPLIDTLKEILNLSKRRIQFRFLPSSNLLVANAFLAIEEDLTNELGQDNIDLVPYMTPAGPNFGEAYMRILQEGSISIDSYPFGGYNSVVDSLHLGIPTVTWKGDPGYSRFASALLEKTGLGELVASNRLQYVDKCLNLIHNDDYREKMKQRLGQINLFETVLNPDHVKFFKRAIDYLIENHDNEKLAPNRNPIVIR